MKLTSLTRITNGTADLSLHIHVASICHCRARCLFYKVTFIILPIAGIYYHNIHIHMHYSWAWDMGEYII